MSRPLAWGVYAFTGAWFAALLLWPIASTVGGAFLDADGKWTLAFVREVFANPIYLEGLANSFLLALGSTVLSVALALPLSLAADRFRFPGKSFLSGLLLVPLILPPFVGAIGVRQVLGQNGALNALLLKTGLLADGHPVDWLGESRFWGVILLNALHLYPILFLNLSAALASVDPAMEEAAENLGASPWRRLSRVTVPLLMPGLFAGATVVFIFAFTELGVPLMFDLSRVTSVQIFYGIKEIAGNPFPFALVVVMLAATLALYLPARLVLARHPGAMAAKASVARSARQAGPLTGALCTGAFLGVSLLALWPHLAVVLVSLAGHWYGTVLPDQWTGAHYVAALGHPLAVPSILNSIQYAGASTLVDLALGSAIAWVLVRTRLPGRWLLDGLSMLPLAVPGLVLAFGYLAMSREGEPFAFLNPFRDPTPLLVIAYAMRRLPYVVRSAVAGLQQTSVTLEEAAQNLGCTPLRTLRRVTLPLVGGHLLAGGVLAFAFAMLEVSDSLILAAQQQHFPITKAIFELFQLIGEGRFLASAMGVWAMALLGLCLFAASRLLGRKLGALFRL